MIRGHCANCGENDSEGNEVHRNLCPHNYCKDCVESNEGTNSCSCEIGDIEKSSNDRAFSTGWDIVKTQINRVKSPSPDAKAGSQKCTECNSEGGAIPCKSCGYMKTPTGKQRQTKPSQRNNKSYQILRSEIIKAKKKKIAGYKSDRGEGPIPKLPTPKKNKNKIK